MDKPERVEVGQVWKDRDERSVGSGEFVVRYVSTGGNAEVYRPSSRRRSWIKVRRLLNGPYEYIGRSR